jgi:hypothetical protein
MWSLQEIEGPAGSKVTHMSTKMIVPEPSAEDLDRINRVLRRVGGANASWGAQSVLDVWTIEQRARQDAVLSRQVLVASWAPVVVTLGLVVATVGLIVSAQ